MRGASIIFLTLIAFVVPFSVGAYSTDGSPSAAAGITGPDFSGLLAPVQNFVNSIGSLSVGVRSMPQGGTGGSLSPQPGITNMVQVVPTLGAAGSIGNAFQSFDQWLYGVAGFHILALFTAILSILSWILGAVKEVVDWVLSAL